MTDARLKITGRSSQQRVRTITPTPLRINRHQRFVTSRRPKRMVHLHNNARFANRTRTTHTRRNQRQTSLTIHQRHRLRTTVGHSTIRQNTLLLNTPRGTIFTRRNGSFTNRRNVRVRSTTLNSFRPFQIATQRTSRRIITHLTQRTLRRARSLNFFTTRRV